MLSRTKEEGSVNQWISVENMQSLLTQCARHARLVLASERREDEQPGVIIAVVTLVFNL